MTRASAPVAWWRKGVIPGGMAVLVGAIWWVRGAHTGWTRDDERVETPDPITGLVRIDFEPRWTPGLDFLLGGLLLCLLIGAVPLLLRGVARARSRWGGPPAPG